MKGVNREMGPIVPPLNYKRIHKLNHSIIQTSTLRITENNIHAISNSQSTGTSYSTNSDPNYVGTK
jgi:hypothetical protein